MVIFVQFTYFLWTDIFCGPGTHIFRPSSTI